MQLNISFVLIKLNSFRNTTTNDLNEIMFEVSTHLFLSSGKIR